MGLLSFYSTLSQPAVDQDYETLFGKSVSADGDLSSLSGQAEQIVKWVRYSLGQPIMTVQLDNKQIFAKFQQANIQFSRLVNTHQVQNWFLSILGSKATGNMTGNQPNFNLSFMRQITNYYSQQSHPIVGGNRNVKKAYIDVPAGQNIFNVLSQRVDNQTGQSLSAFLGGYTAQSFRRIKITEVYHYMSSTVNKYWDVYSISNNFFPSHRLMQNWRYRLRPVFETILNAQMLQQHQMVRQSNYNFNIVGDLLKISPMPPQSMRLWFDYIEYDGVLKETKDIFVDGKDHDITSLWDAPYSNIPYSVMNNIGKRWVRNYCLRLCRQTLGLIRRKFSTLDIPNGNVQLDGGRLVSEGIAKQQTLRDQLRVALDKISLQKAAARDASLGDSMNRILQTIPAGIYIG